VLRNVSLSVAPGGVSVLLGPNGAGKSTVMRAISGLIPATAGTVSVDSQDISSASPENRVRRGIQHVAEGHRIFRQQTVRDNLLLALWARETDRKDTKSALEALTIFPELEPKLDQIAGGLSGGQQQMLAIAQALAARPKVLLIDEPSLGLAPVVIDRVFDALVELRQRGITTLLVEQAVDRALGLADYGYVLRNGAVQAQGTPDELRASGALEHAYLGMPEAGVNVARSLEDG
jgi:branched-chain amino acid transport system ATP-binding protein